MFLHQNFWLKNMICGVRNKGKKWRKMWKIGSEIRVKNGQKMKNWQKKNVFSKKKKNGGIFSILHPSGSVFWTHPRSKKMTRMTIFWLKISGFVAFQGLIMNHNFFPSKLKKTCFLPQSSDNILSSYLPVKMTKKFHLFFTLGRKFPCTKKIPPPEEYDPDISYILP